MTECRYMSQNVYFWLVDISYYNFNIDYYIATKCQYEEGQIDLTEDSLTLLGPRYFSLKF